MRILHFVETLPGGPATYLNELLPYQCDSYDHVSVCCPHDQLSYIQPGKARVIGLPYVGRTPASLFRLYASFLAHAKSNSYDIIHLHSSFAGLLGRVSLLRRKSAIAYCPHSWAHGTNAAPWKRALYRFVEHILSLNTDLIINISESEQRLADLAKIDRRKCRLIYNGIKDASFVPVEENKTPRQLLYVGRYDTQKGVDILIDAMKILKSEDFVLEMIGGGVIAPANISGLPAKVVDRGWRSPAEVRASFERCDVVVMPSRWEGFSLVALEAMRAARPIVASNIKSLTEAVVDQETGILFASGDPHDLANAIRRIAKMNIKQLGENGRRRYEERFTSQRMFEQLDDAYRSVT